ncbi:MAG: hypothetical protein AB1898_29045 [Acidobacteriota bacterium]
MLAYVFWHWKEEQTDPQDYEASLRDFHAVLTADKPPGLVQTVVFRIAGAPWIPANAPAYEDWYLLDGSAALDSLNEAAVSGRRKLPHDAVARQAKGGAGGLYRLRSGAGGIEGAPFAVWLSKPAGVTYERFYEKLSPWTSLPETSLWQRQMTLGPATEFCLHARKVAGLPVEFQESSVCLDRIWPES